MAAPHEQPVVTAAVLVVADVHDELTPFVESLRAVSRLEVTTNERRALSALAEGGPFVLGLAYSCIELSLAFSLRVLKRLASDTDRLQTILFCHRAEAARAYELCRDSVVDDYLVVHPIYDGWQVPLRIKQASDRLAIRGWMSGITAPLGRAGVLECFADLETAAAALAPRPARLEQALEAVRSAVSNLTDQLAHGARLAAESRLRPEAAALTLPSQPAPPPQPDGASPATVLVVDDDDVVRRTVCRSLEAGGYRAVTAADGVECFAALEAERIRLVLMDVEMPGASGFEVTRTIRERWSADELPVIMLTGHGEQQNVMLALQAGASDFLVKPASRRDLLAKVAHGLGQPADRST
jgi:CheY-like chemotaxis protein